MLSQWRIFYAMVNAHASESNYIYPMCSRKVQCIKYVKHEGQSPHPGGMVPRMVRNDIVELLAVPIWDTHAAWSSPILDGEIKERIIKLLQIWPPELIFSLSQSCRVNEAFSYRYTLHETSGIWW